MFPRVASLLALLPMVLHSIVGCCWHHEHVSGCSSIVCGSFTCDSRHPAQADCGSTDPCHGHEQAADSTGQPATPSSPGAPCDEVRCVFAAVVLRAPQQGVEWCVTVCNWDHLPTVSLPVEDDACLQERFERPEYHSPSPAGRLRAQTQVWLV